MTPMTSQQFLKKFAGATVVIFSQCLHLAQLRKRIDACYRNITSLGGWASDLATRDTFRLWRHQVSAQANLLSKLRARTFYATNRMPGTFWTLATAKEPVRCPLPHTAMLARPPTDDTSRDYMHSHVLHVEDMNTAAFLAARHNIIYLDAMLGVRVDAFPSSVCAPCTNSSAGRDAVHMCLPGAPDYAVDVLFREVFGAPRSKSHSSPVRNTVHPKCAWENYVGAAAAPAHASKAPAAAATAKAAAAQQATAPGAAATQQPQAAAAEEFNVGVVAAGEFDVALVERLTGSSCPLAVLICASCLVGVLLERCALSRLRSGPGTAT